MPEFIAYMEQNGFYPRTEDLEAILRRCDHDADRHLTFDEFCEVTELPGSGSQEEVSMIHDTDANNNSPARKEIQEVVAEAQPELKKSNSNDRLDSAPKENIEESWERKEAEERERKYREECEEREKEAEERNRKYQEECEERERQFKEEQQLKYGATFKLVQFLTDAITEQVNHDMQKKMLSYHGSFNVLDFFRELDANRNGFVSSAELAEYFKDDEDIQG